jgi:hypothetical protein
MKTLYLLLAIAGFFAPLYWLLEATTLDNNLFFWTQPTLTLQGMFANTYATGFAVDLLCVVTVFVLWSWAEARRLGMRAVWVYWVLALLFGLAGPFPLFLYFREQRLSQGA